MKKSNLLKAWFFLSVFILMTLINALPHLHHLHQEVNHDTTEVHHHHDAADHHHHEEEPQEKESTLGISFDFLLQNHVHAIHSHEFIQLVKRTSQNILKKQVKVADHFLVFKSQIVRRIKEPVNLVLYNYIFYEAPLIGAIPLRGPPALG